MAGGLLSVGFIMFGKRLLDCVWHFWVGKKKYGIEMGIQAFWC